MSTPWILVGRHLRQHWLRTALTVGSLIFALFLFCFLVSLVTTMRDAVKNSSTNRVIVESAVSLFVDLPIDYQAKIEAVPGVEAVTKFQWFGGMYQDQSNFFANFGVDHDKFLDMYSKEFGIVEAAGGVTGPGAREAAQKALAADRRACIIGEGLARTYHWKIGDTVPLLGTIFPRTDGRAWEFNIVAIYTPLKPHVDDRTLFFRYDFLDETRKAGEASGPSGVGVYSVNVADGHDSAQVIADIDHIFANGPQVTMTTTEAAFQQTFVSMMGNLPFFVGTIGGAVVFAVMFSVVNTMLMSGRQRSHEMGILKALGYTNGAVARLMLAESVTLALLGGTAGALIAWGLDEGMRRAFLYAMLPTYAVSPGTVVAGIGLALVIGLIAGAAPAILATRLQPTQALRSEG